MVARENGSLNCSARRNALVGVDALCRLLPEKLLDLPLHHRHTSGTADQKDLVDLPGGQAGVLNCLARGFHRTLQKIGRHLIEPGSGEAHLKVLGAGGVRCDERKRNRRLGHRGELDLRLLRSLSEPLERHTIILQVDPLGFAELLHHPVDNPHIPVVAAKAVVAGGGEHLEHALANVEDRHVESSAAEVEYKDLMLALLVLSVGEACCRRLVDNAEHFKPGDRPRVLRRLALRVGEIRGNRDHSLRHRLAEIVLRVALHLLQDHRRDLLGSILFPVDGNSVVSSHLTLYGHDRPVAVHDSLALGELADKTLSFLRKRDDGRGCAVSFSIGDYCCNVPLLNSDAAVGCSKIDSYHFRHIFLTS